MPAFGTPPPPPKGVAAPSAGEPLIFVMPEKYRGGASPMIAPKLEAPKPPSKPAVPLPPAKSPLPPKRKPSQAKIVILIGVFVLILFGFGGFFVLQTLKPPPPSASLPTPVSSTTPSQEVEPSSEKPPTQGEKPFPTVTRPGTDSDSDGLTDVEEQTLYATDPFRPDSDADGFLDGNEVFHRYNPNGTAPATLKGAGLVKVYDASVATTADPLPYSILYPSVWTVVVLTAEGAGLFDVDLTSTTGELFHLTMKAKSADQTVADWYATQSEPKMVRPGTTKNGLPMLASDDQLFAVIDGGAWVVELTYDPGAKGSIDYLQTFQMMINSLLFPKSGV